MRANEQMDERLTQYLRLYSCLFQTTVPSCLPPPVTQTAVARPEPTPRFAPRAWSICRLVMPVVVKRNSTAAPMVTSKSCLSRVALVFRMRLFRLGREDARINVRRSCGRALASLVPCFSSSASFNRPFTSVRAIVEFNLVRTPTPIYISNMLKLFFFFILQSSSAPLP